MNIGDRIREIRKACDYNQTDFGAKIGLKQSSLGQIETGVRAASDRVIMLICQTFSINEEWLRVGNGKMFKQDQNTIVSQLSHEYDLDDLDCRIIESYLQLDASKRSIIKDYVRSIFKEQFSMEAAAEIDEEVDSYRRELEKEKTSKMSPALPHSNENIS